MMMQKSFEKNDRPYNTPSWRSLPHFIPFIFVDTYFTRLTARPLFLFIASVSSKGKLNCNLNFSRQRLRMRKQ